jgi:hypothetical protein
MFTIATITHECYGHGSFGKEKRICTTRPYGEGDFPPLFQTIEQASEYLSNMEYNSDKVVVELKIFEPNVATNTQHPIIETPDR